MLRWLTTVVVSDEEEAPVRRQVGIDTEARAACEAADQALAEETRTVHAGSEAPMARLG